MIESGSKLKLPTDCLVPGLYVETLDRPWTDTPFLFQGFVVGEDEIETLRGYCRHVYIDVEASRPDAVNAARSALEARSRQAPARGEEGAGGSQAKQRRRAPGDERPFGDAREPDAAHFRSLVSVAAEGRQRARSTVERVMEDIRLGRSVDSAATRETVQDLVQRVSHDASAALWLTNLKNRDEYTSIHCVNVCVFAVTFGLYLGLERDRLVRLGMGALLHDVGKTRTPPEILNKQGALTREEFEIIKRHPEDGYQLMRASRGISEEALQVVRLHHERIDGSGYPFGLSGDDVPLHVRIAGLADSYDAMTSDRTYANAIAADQALHTLYRKSGQFFGDELVQQFIKCLGIFPVGSVVELDNGAVGVVVATRADARLQPTLLLVRTPDGQPYSKRLLLNLATEAPGSKSHVPRRIARSLRPEDVEVDVTRVVAEEFGLPLTT